RSPHPWPRTVAEARAIQEALGSRVIARDRIGRLRQVAGVDASYDRAAGVTRAAVAVLSFPGLEPAAQRVVQRRTRFPYIPGYLSFRETPALLAALAGLRRRPDLILCDGQGLAHPRRFGLASHLGVLLNAPTIGVAKSRLVGTHGPVPEARGAWVPLRDGAETIGAVLRTRAGARPVYVSVGHRVSLETAIETVLRCAPRYGLPEPVRRAHALASG
ncbi:MAG: deoxyribonuclease V, partial [Proteobacteria bacterium]|nr:deoxyribonuclease V [Pseudomonadota bacterium]